MHRAAKALLAGMVVAACSSAPPVASPGLPSATASSPQQTAPTIAPTFAPTTSPNASVAAITTGFDGVWASDPLTKQSMDAALAIEGLDPASFHPWFEDWTGVDHRIFEAAIGNGKWTEKEFQDGILDGGGEANVVAADESTVTVADPDSGCRIVMHLSRSGPDQLSMKVGDDACGADDLALETAIYEASPFRLIQAADWKAPDSSPPPKASPTPLPPSTSAKRLVQQLARTVPGAPLGYVEYLPPSYTVTGAKSPLLLFLHGSGESGAGDLLGLSQLEYSALPGMIYENKWPDSRPFVVLAPQHDDSKPPSYCMEATEIDGFLKFALEHYNIDPTRVYVTGISCGAIGLWNYLDVYDGGLVAAAVPLAGNGLQAILDHGCELGKVPIWAFHGALDPNDPIETEVFPMTTLEHCGSAAAVDAKLTVFPLSSHDVWTRTYGMNDGYDIFSWMLSHHN